MANKIKITEGQLKKIMAVRINEQHEGDVEESAAGGVGLSLVPNKLEDMTASYIRQVKEIVGQSDVHNTQFTYDQLLSQLSDGLTADGGEESNLGGEEQMPNYEAPEDGGMDMMNESIEKIKSEFNRFL